MHRKQRQAVGLIVLENGLPIAEGLASWVECENRQCYRGHLSPGSKPLRVVMQLPTKVLQKMFERLPVRPREQRTLTGLQMFQRRSLLARP